MLKFWTMSLEWMLTSITTYKKAIKPVDKILSDNASFLKSRFNLKVNEINKTFPLRIEQGL